ncbi:hypothetical protein Hanom_Chr12g01112801 [Helianthus anomalus]
MTRGDCLTRNRTRLHRPHNQHIGSLVGAHHHRPQRSLLPIPIVIITKSSSYYC